MGAMGATACGERGGYSVAVSVAGSRPGSDLSLWARNRRRRNAALTLSVCGCPGGAWRLQRNRSRRQRAPFLAEAAPARTHGRRPPGFRRSGRVWAANVLSFFSRADWCGIQEDLRVSKRAALPRQKRARLMNLGNITIGASSRLRLQLSNLGTERPHFFAYLCGRQKPRASHVSERLVETRLVGNCLPYVDCVRECGVM